MGIDVCAMRFLIISDLHGSAEAFQAVAEAFAYEDADAMICCGDFLYHGPRNNLPIGYEPKELAPLLNQYKDKIYAVRGNCDAEVDQFLLEFPIMAPYILVCNGASRCFVTHGHLFNEDRMPPLSAGDIFISGHTHVPRLERVDGILYVNPGSTTLPKSLSKPGYGVMDEKTVTLKALCTHDIVKTVDL